MERMVSGLLMVSRNAGSCSTSRSCGASSSIRLIRGSALISDSIIAGLDIIVCIMLRKPGFSSISRCCRAAASFPFAAAPGNAAGPP